MRTPYRKPGKYSQIPEDTAITQKKFDQLQAQLDRLKSISHKEAASEVQRLAELGDFSENAEYQLAKGRLRGILFRMQELQYKLDHALIIPEQSDSSVVSLGCTVKVDSMRGSQTFLILGSSETNPQKNIISHLSPLGRALMGRKIGETVSLEVGGKILSYTIVAIE